MREIKAQSKIIEESEENNAKYFWILLVIIFTIVWTIGVIKIVSWKNNHTITPRSPIILQSPIVIKEIVEATTEAQVESSPSPSPAVSPLPSSKPKSQLWQGIASYYDWTDCLGCNAGRIMANGQVLDDTKHTLAFNWLPMNTKVLVTNVKNNLIVEAMVTDTGGFTAPEYGRIADLSLATKNAINCSDLCEVKIKVI